MIDNKIFHDFPVARYLCRQKGHNKTGHRTFSLLPHYLAPYHQHDLNIMVDTLQHQNQQVKVTLEQTKDFISAQGQTTDIPLENYHIHHFNNLFVQAYYKLITIPELIKHVQSDKLHNDPVKTMLNFIDTYQSPFQTTRVMNASNIQKLAWDFFFNFQTSSFLNRHFLLGTPSQKQY